MKNVCIVGYGAIGPVHAGAVSAIENVNLYAVCDNDLEKLEQCGIKYKVRLYDSFDDVIGDEEIDSVHICTPHYLHKDMAIKAMKAGKDVVLEKPAAMNEDELDELLAVKKETGRRVCLVLQNRTNGSIREMKKLAESGELGKLIGIEGSLAWKRNEAYYNSAVWRGTKDMEGGGVLINQAIHLIDLFSFVGGGIKSVRGGTATRTLGEVIEVEDSADAIFEMGSGVRGAFYATNSYSGDKPVRLELQFEKAILRYADNRLYKITDECEVIAADNMKMPGKSAWGAGHYNAIYDFYNSENYITLEDGENAMRTLFAFYKSASQNGKEVEVKI